MRNVLFYSTIQTCKALASRATIRALGEALQSLDREFIPDRYGYTDRGMKPFDPTAVDEQLRAVYSFNESVVLRFRRPMNGHISLAAARGLRVPYNGAVIQIDYSNLKCRLNGAVSLVKSLCSVFDAAYACATLAGGNPKIFHLDDLSKNWGDLDGLPVAPVRPSGLSYLPGIFWLNVFGPEYIEFFGRSRLESAPGYTAEFIDGGDRFWLQSTKHPEESITPRGELVTEQIKKHLGHPKAFSGHDPDTPPFRTTYETPIFDFSEIRNLSS